MTQKLIVEKINSWEEKIKNLPDKNFPIKTAEFKSKIKNEITSRYQLDIKIPQPFSKSVFSKFDTTDLSTDSKKIYGYLKNTKTNEEFFASMTKTKAK